MPAAHDIYVEQLMECRRGTPLYYPEPDSSDGPIEIGDVGFLREGAFVRLFNVTRSADDPRQRFGVPKGFQRLDMGHIQTIDSALEPGPLHSKTVSGVGANVGVPSTVLPLDASFNFKCTSNRGAILMQETQMKLERTVQNELPDRYLREHCDAWHAFACEQHIRLSFGEILFVTECSKAGAWSSAVYFHSSQEFSVSFSLGSAFVPCALGLTATTAVQNIGPIQRRRSPQRPTLDPSPTKDHTVFFKAARLGTRELYKRSFASVFMLLMNARKKNDITSGNFPQSYHAAMDHGNISSLGDSFFLASASGHYSSLDLAMLPDLPDLHPAIPLLAMEMENTDTDCVIVYDDAWCHSSQEASQVIGEYIQFHFEDCETLMKLALDVQEHPPRSAPVQSGLHPDTVDPAEGQRCLTGLNVSNAAMDRFNATDSIDHDVNSVKDGDKKRCKGFEAKRLPCEHTCGQQYESSTNSVTLDDSDSQLTLGNKERYSRSMYNELPPGRAAYTSVLQVDNSDPLWSEEQTNPNSSKRGSNTTNADQGYKVVGGSKNQYYSSTHPERPVPLATAYDYTPEACERYLSIQKRVNNWVDRTDGHRPEFKKESGPSKFSFFKRLARQIGRRNSQDDQRRHRSSSPASSRSPVHFESPTTSPPVQGYPYPYDTATKPRQPYVYPSQSGVGTAGPPPYYQPPATSSLPQNGTYQIPAPYLTTPPYSSQPPLHHKPHTAPAPYQYHPLAHGQAQPPASPPAQSPQAAAYPPTIYPLTYDLQEQPLSHKPVLYQYQRIFSGSGSRSKKGKERLH